MPAFDLQGHRGARGLKPENTLPGFEVALDVGVTSLETDIHLTRDGTLLLVHDACLHEKICTLPAGTDLPAPASRPPIRSLDLGQLRHYRLGRNPDPDRFPGQDPSLTPLADLFARERGFHPYAAPTLTDLLAFVAAYAGDLGREAGKTAEQRGRASKIRFDLETKRVPFRPDVIGDEFTGAGAGLLERLLVEQIQSSGVVDRVGVRSFDHRSVRAVHTLEPRLATSILIAETAPVDPALLAQQAGARTYCPCVEFLDLSLVRRCQEAGVRVVPWTINDPQDWRRLLDWGVDGITTDYPDRLGVLLRERGVAF